MTFQHVEEALVNLPDECTEKYLEVFGDLQEPTRTVLGYALDIASYLNKNLLGDDYILFGGYAVLSHLMDQFGEEVAKVWRGSKDIDMAGTQRALHAIKAGYDVRSDFPSPNLPDKRTLKLVEDAEAECKIDFYTGDMERRFYSPELHKPFGISLRVCDPLSLTEGKLLTPEDEVIHSVDIMRLLAIMEKRGYSPEEISRFFTADQKADLIERIRKGYEATRGERIGILPGGEFMGELERILHKGKPINTY